MGCCARIGKPGNCPGGRAEDRLEIDGMVNRKRVPVVWKYAEPKNPFRDPHAEPPQYVRAKAGHRLAVGIHPLRLEITGPRWWDEACRRYFSSLAAAKRYHEVDGRPVRFAKKRWEKRPEEVT